jgi:hypothetical protein
MKVPNWLVLVLALSTRAIAAEPQGSPADEFWSFQPPRRHFPPEVSRPEWVRQPIDVFVLAKLDAANLSPSSEAERRVLIRRVTFDVIGLPPTPEEVDAFVNDGSPDAYRTLVERLLASPHFGERWARPWLDLARYAEDQAHIVGSDTSLFYPNAYKYRDWVIRALNADMPCDEFVQRQLATDLMDPEDETHLAALGFIGLGPKYYRRNAPEVMADEWEDRVDVVTRGLLGLTVACARCHDHKYDPIPATDYYRIASIFASTEMYNRPLAKDAELGKNGQAKKAEEALHIIRDVKPQDLHVHIRGDVDNKGPLVERGFLQALCEGEPQRFTNGSGRLELARAIVSHDNPLTARVLVNRVWGQVFGRPLVATPSNFGSLGEEPTHPELLDDLAVRFMESGWSMKSLVREMVLSATYRQSSHIDSYAHSVNPENNLLWRMNRRRLDVESWRDAILAAVGRLDPAIGGPSIDPSEPASRRRTIYSEVSRFEVNRMLALFDFPDPNVHSDQRVETTTPLQKLFVLNSPFMVRQAEALAERLRTEAGPDAESRIRRGYQLVYGRAPTDEELRLGLEYVEATEVSWRDYAQVLLASNEALMVD